MSTVEMLTAVFRGLNDSHHLKFSNLKPKRLDEFSKK
jgi:hypothetical protein